MVAVNVVGRLLHQSDLHAYRRRLAHTIRQRIAFRLLPTLLDLPLEIGAPAGLPPSLHGVLRTGRHLTLSGPSGTGRRLALLQIALRWAEGTLADIPPPVLIDLPRLDDGRQPPDELLGAAALAALRSSDPVRRREPLAFLRRMVSDDEQPPQQHLLLIHGWDELPPERRDLWRAELCAIAESDASAQLLVALTPGEPAWPDFTPLALAPLTPTLCASWVEHLAPPELRADIMAALAPGGSLAALGDRLFEIALLAWLTPSVGMPHSRAELYNYALASILGLAIDQLDQDPSVAALQLLAAYDEPAPQLNTNLIEYDPHGRAHFLYPQVRRHLAARQLVAERRFDLLRQVDTTEAAELALLITTMLDDPAPLYAALWEPARAQLPVALILARCLRERAPHNPTWTLRVVAALARHLHADSSDLHEYTHRLLAEHMPALDETLAVAARAEEPVQRFLTQLFELLPPALALPRIQRLVLNSETPESFAWQLTDRLLEHTPADQAVLAPPHVSPPAMARWIYVQALQDPASCRQIEPATMVAALHALAGSIAGESRKLFVASALVEDPGHAIATRLAALELLAGNSQPTAHTVVERACSDASSEIRRKALEILSQLDPARAAVALGRTAKDHDASWDLRLAAIRHLGETQPPGADRLLAHCTQDASLPLFARVKAVAALAGNRDGAGELQRLLENTGQHPIVRGAAASALGHTGAAMALLVLVQLLDDPQTPTALLTACCRGLGNLHDRGAAVPVARLLARIPEDVELTLEALDALGQIGDPETVETISPLLGQEAILRLQRVVEPSLLGQPVDECLASPALPQPIADRLTHALAASPGEETRPTTLAEFLALEADRIRTASAHALTAIGGNTARAALLAALLDESTGAATADLIAALAEIEGDASADSLGYLLNAPEINPLTHWLVARHLTTHPAGEQVMLQSLQNGALDAFTRGALAEGLGQRHAMSALTPLRHLAENAAIDPHLRAQAVLGLGLLDDPTTETILIRLIGDANEDITLRGLAAEHLPQQLSAEGRRFLRDLLRSDRLPTPLVIGALRTLGRVRDREALPMMLRYCQGEAGEVAQAAIEALADLGDGSVAPVLVRISQQPSTDHALRLQAVSGLLRIGGDGYLPLLRSYLHQGALPFRMLALEALLASRVTTTDLLPILTNTSWPLAMRLRLLDFFAGDTAAAPALIGLLDSANDELQLRMLAAEELGRMRYPAVAPALIRQAEHADAPLTLRLRCLTALEKLKDTGGWAAISRIAEDATQPSVLREAAQHALRMPTVSNIEQL